LALALLQRFQHVLQGRLTSSEIIDIVDKSCAAWRFFADDPERVASITSRTWATVNP
jgi:hypothetical protein